MSVNGTLLVGDAAGGVTLIGEGSAVAGVAVSGDFGTTVGVRVAGGRVGVELVIELMQPISIAAMIISGRIRFVNR